MPFVYILYSPGLDSFYTGAAFIDVNDRLQKHIDQHYDGSYTVKTKDWEIFFWIECPSMPIALQIEKHIKRMKSKKIYPRPENIPRHIAPPLRKIQIVPSIKSFHFFRNSPTFALLPIISGFDVKTSRAYSSVG